ncbi:MAG: CBS domain-containing protein [Actinocatenispora sp.]
MTTAREIMHAGVECVNEQKTMADTARMMRDSQIGALPVCDTQDRVTGIVTDRDLVIHGMAEGVDPQSAGLSGVASDNPVRVDGDAEVSDVVHLMEQHSIRRLPVMEDGHVVGMISEADLAAHLPESETGQFVEDICSAPPTP